MTPDLRWDAEHYRPEYLRQEKAVASLKTIRLGDAAEVSDGNHLSIAEEFCENGVRYLRGQDLSDFFISDADPVFIPETNYAALTRSHMFPGDVLVGIVGTIGTVGLVTERHGKLTGNCKLAIVRPKSLPAEYLAVYLASRLGQYEIARRTRGAVQMGLILPDLRELPIAKPSNGVLDRVVSLVTAAKKERKRAADTIESAESAVTQALGLNQLDLRPQKYYTAHFTDLQIGNRFGAEYYMPCKHRVLKALAKQPHRTIADHAQSIREMWDPRRAGKGEQVLNYDVTNALEPVLTDDVETQSAAEIGSTKKRLAGGDVVISRLRSYLKQIAIVQTPNKTTAVGSSEFIVLRPNSDGLSAETLMVFLRCPLVQTVLRWSQDGSNHPRFAEEDLLAIPVPDAVGRVQKRIERLVHEALHARRESSNLLHRAKRTVEQMISDEEGASSK